MPDLIRHPETLDSGFRRNDDFFTTSSNLELICDLGFGDWNFKYRRSRQPEFQKPEGVAELKKE